MHSVLMLGTHLIDFDPALSGLNHADLVQVIPSDRSTGPFDEADALLPPDETRPLIMLYESPRAFLDRLIRAERYEPDVSSHLRIWSQRAETLLKLHLRRQRSSILVHINRLIDDAPQTAAQISHKLGLPITCSPTSRPVNPAPPHEATELVFGHAYLTAHNQAWTVYRHLEAAADAWSGNEAALYGDSARLSTDTIDQAWRDYCQLLSHHQELRETASRLTGELDAINVKFRSLVETHFRSIHFDMGSWFPGNGWHDSERDKLGRHYRWLGQQGVLAIPLPSHTYRLTLAGPAYIDLQALRTMRVAFNGHHLPRDEESEIALATMAAPGERLKSVYRAMFHNMSPERWKIAYQIPKGLIRVNSDNLLVLDAPAARSARADQRSLSVCFSSITFEMLW